MSSPGVGGLERGFPPLGEWGDVETRERIAFIIAEGKQGSPEEIRKSLPQSDGCIALGAEAPSGKLSLSTLDGSRVLLADVFAADAQAGKVTLLNFGSYT